MKDRSDVPVKYRITPAEMDEIRREAIAFAGIGLYRYRFDGTVLFMDDGAMRILGLEGRADSSQELVGQDIADLIIYEGPRGYLRKNLREYGHVRGLEYPFRTLDGEARWALHDSFLVRDPFLDEEVIQVIIKDITPRKRAEVSLAKERERLAVTLRSIGDGVIATDIEARITLINRVAEQLTGWSAEEAVGRPVSEVFRIIHEQTREPCPNPVEKVLDSGGIVGLANHTALISRGGEEYVIADSGAPIRDPRSRVIGVVLVFRDITHQQRLEEEVQRVEKLQSVGVLAGGIAHDFNNLLSAILGNISLGKLYAGRAHSSFKLLEQAEKATLRAKDLTQQLLTFARGGTPVREAAGLEGVVTDSVTFALSGSAASLEMTFPPDLWTVSIDAGQIGQVFQNLALNAEQAMPQGGQIRITARNRELLPGHGLPVAEGRYVEVTFKDTGTGISPAALARIFDPYYSTKKEGSGLGLTICHSIITHHEGHISVRSKLGEGTLFTVLLPVAGETAGEAVEEVREGPLPGGRILVMDDEQSVREVAEHMLRHLGFEVVTVERGEDAIASYREAMEKGEAFTAVILDLTVPGGMGGAQTVRQLRKLDPEVVAIASSGYSSDPVMSRARLHSFNGALPKPYSIQELVRVLSRALAVDEGEEGGSGAPAAEPV